jgi:hypothetical protein
MTQQHPITPPPELVQQWEEDWHHSKVKHIELEPYIAAQAAQWGADQELEACLGEVSFLNSQALADRVRAARRTKPPSLKEQALQALGRFSANAHANADKMMADFELLRCAVEQLDD